MSVFITIFALIILGWIYCCMMELSLEFDVVKYVEQDDKFEAMTVLFMLIYSFFFVLVSCLFLGDIAILVILFYFLSALFVFTFKQDIIELMKEEVDDE